MDKPEYSLVWYESDNAWSIMDRDRVIVVGIKDNIEAQVILERLKIQLELMYSNAEMK